MTYTTIQGDVWDMIAWKIYGRESAMSELMDANRQYIDTLVFSAGTVLQVPEIPEEKNETAPFWRQDAGGEDDAYYSPVLEVDED